MSVGRSTECLYLYYVHTNVCIRECVCACVCAHVCVSVRTSLRAGRFEFGRRSLKMKALCQLTS